FLGRLADGVTRRCDQAQRRWMYNSGSERLALVPRVLHGCTHDRAKAASVLRYEIQYRHPLAVCVWPAGDSAVDDPDLEAAAVQFLRSHQAAQTLITRQPDSTVVAWGNSRSPLPYPAGT